MILEGAFTALITPFKEDKSLDLSALENLVKFQIDHSIDGLVAAGSTGESVCFTEQEHYEVVRSVVKTAKKRVPVIAGIGSNDTAKAIRLGVASLEAGADAVMAVMPFYNRPPSRGVISHFTSIAKEVDIPLILYNVPSRTASDIDFNDVKKLAEIRNIIGIKDASGELKRVSQYNGIKNFIQLCGEDIIIDKYYENGGNGSISVVSNVIPGDWAQIYLQSKKDILQSKKILSANLPLIEALSCDVNPIPIKYALHRMGFCKNEYRLPLVPLMAKDREVVDSCLRAHGLI